MDKWLGSGSRIGLLIVMVIVLMTKSMAARAWRKLFGYYCASAPFSGKKFYACSARLRAYCSHNHILTIGANPKGMYASVLSPFQFGHFPLFIPWDDISAETKRILRVNVVMLQFAKCPDIPFWISRRLADKLEAASGVRFIEDSNM